jgi:rhodanese-related sulfurtransferase
MTTHIAPALAGTLTLSMICAGGALAEPAAGPGGAEPARLMAPFCAGCHAPMPGTMMGFLDTASDKAQALQLDVGGRSVVVGFDRDTVLKNVASFADLGKYKRKGFLVTYEDRDQGRVATSIVRFDIASTISEGEKLSTAAFKAALANPSVTVLDVRPPPMYAASHVPGAGSMPALAVAEYVRHLPEDRNAPVVLYGPGGCLGPTTSLRVKQLGYTDVKLYPAGFGGWSRTEFGVTSPDWLRQLLDQQQGDALQGVVILDVRPPEAAEAGRIRGAVNVPLAELSSSRDRFPSAATAPMVVYGEGSEQAARQLVDWGYHAVRVLPMAYADWAAAGHPVSSGPMSSGPEGGKIVYRPKPKPGAIDMDEFKRLAKAPREGMLLIDLRNPAEVDEPAAAHIVNIPFDALPERMPTLTQGPTPVFYCPTGARAEMAHSLVSQAGGESRFMPYGVLVGADGELRDARPWWAP